tara:strand:- start:663 stop:842 length:180 start_codon:yes stop_codon:yes gene_type:complete
MKNDRPTGMNALVMNSRKEIFNNPQVRLALSYAMIMNGSIKLYIIMLIHVQIVILIILP